MSVVETGAKLDVPKVAETPAETPLHRFLSDYFASWIATAAFAVLLLIVAAALLVSAEQVAFHAPREESRRLEGVHQVELGEVVGVLRRDQRRQQGQQAEGGEDAGAELRRGGRAERTPKRALRRRGSADGLIRPGDHGRGHVTRTRGSISA